MSPVLKIQFLSSALPRRKAALRTGLESPRCSVSLSCLQVYVQRVCEDVFADPLNSAVQLAGLRLLTNMTVTNDYQHLLSSYITGLLHLLLTGNGSTKVGSRCAKLRRDCISCPHAWRILLIPTLGGVEAGGALGVILSLHNEFRRVGGERLGPQTMYFIPVRVP